MARRKHRIPYQKWVAVFGMYNRIMGAAQRYVEAKHPELFAGIMGAGNVIRLGLAKAILPAMHTYFANHPDIATPEAAAAYVIKAINAVDADIFTKALKAFNPELTDEQLNRLWRAFQEMRQYINENANALVAGAVYGTNPLAATLLQKLQAPGAAAAFGLQPAAVTA